MQLSVTHPKRDLPGWMLASFREIRRHVESGTSSMRPPDVRTLEEYRAIYHEETLWRPIIDDIRERHGLSDEPCHRGPDGTHLVYFAGPSYVVKLFVPLFEHDFVAESLVARHLEGRLGVATPTIVHQGETAGWHYLVMTRVPGYPLLEVWPGIPDGDRQAIARTIGEMIARLRSLSVEGVRDLAVDWPAFLARQVATAAERQSGGGLPEGLVEQIPAYLESTAVHLAEDFEPVLLLADITDEHVLVSQDGGSWRVVGYVDFGDAFLGHPDHELVAPGLSIARGDRRLLRALLLGAGYSEPDLNKELRRRLMAHTLVHQYLKLEDVMTVVPQARRATSLEELARILWPVCQPGNSSRLKQRPC
jgi:hygromycin-B 7''-O-kinase